MCIDVLPTIVYITHSSHCCGLDHPVLQKTFLYLTSIFIFSSANTIRAGALYNSTTMHQSPQVLALQPGAGHRVWINHSETREQSQNTLECYFKMILDQSWYKDILHSFSEGVGRACSEFGVCHSSDVTYVQQKEPGVDYISSV